MLSEQLKEKTKEAHQSLEAIVVRQIKSIRTKEQYAELLYKFYGFHSPMEKLFDQHFNDQLVPAYADRRKAELLLQDIKNLGTDSIEIPHADTLPAIDSLARAFGAFYVLEGSTQGGTIVADMLIKYAGQSPATTSFFNVYGDDKKQMWQSFKDSLNTYSGNADFENAAISAANDTFNGLKQWMLK